MTSYRLPDSTPALLKKQTKLAYRRGLGILAIAVLLSNIMFLGHNQPGGSAHATTGTTPVVNPTLGQSCGLDIGLIIDTSGSMDESEMIQVKSALTGFTGAFTGTPTVFSLTTFATNATVVKPFSLTSAQVADAITNDVPNVGDGNTNWDAALTKSFSSFDPRTAKPNLIVIATDGSPNRYGDPATSTFDWNEGLSHAITEANVIKNAGTRILVVGIGGDPTDPAYPNTDYKLQAISGPNMAPPGSVSATTDVVKTDFAQLGSAMSELAKSMCGGKILVQKQLDTNGDGRVDIDGTSANAQLSGWQFSVDGTPSHPADQTTTNTGALEFSVLTGTYAVSEAASETSILTKAVCRNGDQVVGTVDLANQRVTDLPMGTDDTISCTFVNRPKAGDITVIKHVVGGTAVASDFTMHLGQDLSFPGSETGTTKHVTPGTYAVSESDGPAKYDASYSGDCNDQGQITIADAESKTCTVTNTRQIDPVFAIALEKHAPATVNAGAQMTYSLNWSVAGNTAVTNAKISDPLPANTTFVSADTNGVNTNNVVTWDLGTKNPGDHGTVSVTVAVASPMVNGTVLKNTACMTSDQTEKSCDTATTKVCATPIVHIDKTAPATVLAGDNMTYTLNWSVAGNASVTNAVISDPLPANTTFVSADQGGTNTTNTVSWNLGAKNPGDHGTVTVTVKVATPLANATKLVNTACLTTTEVEKVCDTATTTVTSASTLTIDKQAAATIIAGKQLVYTISWSVTGNAPLSQVNISDPLPANTIFVSADSSGVNTNNIVTWDLGNKNPGDHGTVTVTVAVASPIVNGTILTNKACLSAKETAQACDTTTTTVESAPLLTIQKSNSLTTFTNPGATVTYTVVITNGTGATDSARAVTMVDTLPTGFTLVNGGGSSITFTLGDIAPATSVTRTYQAVISAAQGAGSYINTAVAQGSNTAAVKATSTVEVRVPAILGTATQAILGLTKTANLKDVRSGDVVLYTITVKSTGDADLFNVVVTDPLPVGMVNMASGATTVTWNVGTLAFGSEKSMTFPVKITDAMKAGVVTNLATATATDIQPVTAKAVVTIHKPQVLGLATTGVGLRDYLIFTVGAGLILAGFLIIRRQRQAE